MVCKCNWKKRTTLFNKKNPHIVGNLITKRDDGEKYEDVKEKCIASSLNAVLISNVEFLRAEDIISIKRKKSHKEELTAKLFEISTTNCDIIESVVSCG